MTAPVPTLPNGQPSSGSTTLFEYRLASDGAFTPVAVALTAAALVGAVSLAVTALSGPIKAGSALHFNASGVGDKLAIVTADAASGATTINVFPLAQALDATDTASYDGFLTLPVLGEVNLALSPQAQNYQAYSPDGVNVWDYAVKTGMGGTITVRTGAPASHPAVTKLIQAGLKSGGAGLILFRNRLPDGSYYYGASTIGVTPMTPVRGVLEHQFTGTTSGPIGFQPAA